MRSGQVNGTALSGCNRLPLALFEPVVTWLVTGSPDLPTRGRPRMAHTISEGTVALEINGAIISTARMRADGWWSITHLFRFFDRNQAITAFTITELIETEYSNDHPLVAALREELR